MASSPSERGFPVGQQRRVVLVEGDQPDFRGFVSDFRCFGVFIRYFRSHGVPFRFFSFLPRLPPGWYRAKSSRVKPRPAFRAMASPSATASWQDVLAVGASPKGPASPATDTCRIAALDRARLDEGSPGDRNDRRAVRGRGFATAAISSFGLPAVGKGNNHIPLRHLAAVPVDAVGRIQEIRLRSGTLQCGRQLAADMAGFPHAGDVNAPSR